MVLLFETPWVEEVIGQALVVKTQPSEDADPIVSLWHSVPSELEL